MAVYKPFAKSSDSKPDLETTQDYTPLPESKLGGVPDRIPAAVDLETTQEYTPAEEIPLPPKVESKLVQAVETKLLPTVETNHPSKSETKLLPKMETKIVPKMDSKFISTLQAKSAPAPSSPPPAPKKVMLSHLGDFRLVGKLGEGGMGTVYKAVQESKHRFVALKVLSKDMATKPGFVQRFDREVRSMAQLDHPNIVRLYRAGEDHGFVYLAMELLEGGSIGAWLEKLGHFSVADAAHIARAGGAALLYAHERGFVHRDVKPDNLLIAGDGTVKLADMGLAKTAEDTLEGLTQTGVGIGTPIYAAPEQARDAKNVDARCDIYSLGCVFYRCLVGKPPFFADSLLGIIKAKEKGVYEAAHSARKKVPKALDKILAKMLAKHPDHRYGSAAEFLEELDFSETAGERLSFLPKSSSDRDTKDE